MALTIENMDLMIVNMVLTIIKNMGPMIEDVAR